METKKEIEKMIDELCQLDQAIQDGRKIEKTSLCKEAAEVLKAIFHIQDQEHKTIIRDESKIKTNEVEKKRSGKWIKTMKPLKKFYEKYGERVYVTGFGVGYSTDMPCILKTDVQKEEIDRSLQHLLKIQNLYPEVNVTYFVPDYRKHGGFYETYIGRLKRVDTKKKRLVFAMKKRLNLDYCVT